jgi:large subunit ribosomal protein L17
MRHNVKGRKLGRTTEHRLALFRNQLSSLVAHGRIRTTLAKAKELRPLAERMITKGKRGDLDARRQVRRWIENRALIKKLFEEVAPRFQERPGGYLRIVKLGPRKGDGAEMALLEMVDFELDTGKKKKAPAPEPKAKGKRGAKEAEPAPAAAEG